MPHDRARKERYPWAIAVPVLNILAIANIPRAIYKGWPFYAFISSACSIVAFTFLFGLSLFRDLIASRLDPEWSLNVYNAASSEKTLGIMAVIAVLGMPFVLSYTVVVYWVFRGKVRLGRFSY